MNNIFGVRERGREPLLCGVEATTGTLDISRTTLYKIIAAGGITPVKIGRRTLIRFEELERIAEHGWGGPSGY